MTTEEARNRIYRFIETFKICGNDNYNPTTNITKQDYEALKLAFKALEQQSSDDCISRVEALKAIEKEKQGWEGAERYAIDECHSRIAELPSVTPQPKIGKWTPMSEGFSPYGCSECEAVEVKKSKYCPNCGVKMEVEE